MHSEFNAVDDDRAIEAIGHHSAGRIRDIRALIYTVVETKTRIIFWIRYAPNSRTSRSTRPNTNLCRPSSPPQELLTGIETWVMDVAIAEKEVQTTPNTRSEIKCLKG
jgi:hypothetical protein